VREKQNIPKEGAAGDVVAGTNRTGKMLPKTILKRAGSLQKLESGRREQKCHVHQLKQKYNRYLVLRLTPGQDVGKAGGVMC